VGRRGRGRGGGVHGRVGARPAAAVSEHPEIGSPIGVQAWAEPPLDVLIPAAGVVVLVALVVAAGSLVGRFRRARGTERQQLRWLAWAA
jgi:hypothetical protein